MREFLARNSIEYELRDVRKAPIPGDQAIALVRKHKRGLAKKGAKVHEVEIAGASDDELRKLFLGREGFLRAPTVSDGTTVFSGFDEAEFRRLTQAK